MRHNAGEAPPPFIYHNEIILKDIALYEDQVTNNVFIRLCILFGVSSRLSNFNFTQIAYWILLEGFQEQNICQSYTFKNEFAQNEANLFQNYLRNHK